MYANFQLISFGLVIALLRLAQLWTVRDIERGRGGGNNNEQP